MRVLLSDIMSVTRLLLVKTGVDIEQADIVADIFRRATLRGTGHHDISELPGRLRALETGVINPKPKVSLINAHRALEGYEGDNGLGETHGMFISKHALNLSKVYGIGLCTIRNSNHILACAPYVDWMAEQGMLGYIITRGSPSMGAPGRKEQVCGTAPQAYSVMCHDGMALSFDACLAYASFGELKSRSRNKALIPDYWALDGEGKSTNNPDEVINGGTRLPIGAHKGFGLAILGEILTGVLSDGQIIDEKQPESGRIGIPSHTAICLDVGALIGRDRFPLRTEEMIQRMKTRAPGLLVPGERASKYRIETEKNNAVEIAPETVAEINEYCLRYRISCLSAFSD